MKTKLRQFLIGIVFFLTSTMVMADDVVCPPVNLIQQAWNVLDTVTLIKGTQYAVFSNHPAFSHANFYWKVITYMDAPDFTAAFARGQSNVKEVNTMMHPTATDLGEVYICGYAKDATNVMHTAAITPKARNNSHTLNNILVSLNFLR